MVIVLTLLNIKIYSIMNAFRMQQVAVLRSKFCKHLLALFLFTSLLLAGFYSNCQVSKATQSKQGQSLFTLLPPESTGIYFRNDVVDTNINPLTYLNANNGGGVAAGDLNNDGLCDLVFISNEKGPSVYLNKGEMKFDNITSKSGLTDFGGWYTGVTMIDINADGWLDIYVCRSGPDSTKWSNLLFINNHDGTFTEEAKKYNLQNNQPCTEAIFFDYDNDGDLDVYLVNHPSVFNQYTHNFYAYSDSALFKLGKDRLMENIGGAFVDVSDKAGINYQLSYGLSACVTDVNNDGYPDLYVCNDFLGPDHFYINNGDKTFTEKTSEYFKETSLFSMGSDFGDLNNDGYPDLVVADMMWDNHKQMKTHFGTMAFEWYKQLHKELPPQQFSKNSLQLSNDGKFFSQISLVAGIAKTGWSWNVNIDDLNNDGLNDIFITQGMKRDLLDLDYMQLQMDASHSKGFRHDSDSMLSKAPASKDINHLFINKGNLNFSDESVSSGLPEKVISNGAVTADLNNDGNLELIVNNTDDFASIYRNNSYKDSSKHFLRIKCEGDKLNKFGIGTVVDLYTSVGRQHKQVANSRGFESCPESVLHFGLDNIKNVDSIVVKWYDRTTQTLYNVAANQVITVKKTDAKKTENIVAALPTLMTEVHPKGLSNLHKEDDFADFKKDRLLPFMMSREGPSMATGDVNKDGLLDVFIGGAYKGSSGQLLLQQKDGSFLPAASQPWKKLNIETTGAVFADFNGDGYPDLYLANGSNEYSKDDTLLRDRLYLNNAGNGFTDASYMLPVMKGVKTSPVAFDFNGDGKMDLFVAGRMTPGEYPSSSRSYLLRNDGKHFTDVTETMCPELAKIGNTCAAWAGDLNKDGKPDLVIASEWQPIMFYKNTGKSFLRVLTGSALDTLKGWWKCIVPADLNTDGKMDFLIGNQGTNTYLAANPKEPVTLYYNDFDDNGVKEPLVTHYLKGEVGFLYDRATFCEQMPKYRKKFLTYEKYSEAKVSDIVTDEKMKTSEKYEANFLKSIWIENKGDFHFEIHELPGRVQWSPANTFAVADLNGDNKPDVIVAGNSESDLYWAGLSCASPGVVMLNNGKNDFTPIDINKSGFVNTMVCRHLQVIPINGFKSKCLLVANNNNELRVFQLPQ